MQKTSTTFEPYASVRIIDTNISFELFDVNAKNSAVPEGDWGENVSQIDQLTDGTTEIGSKWATLEDGIWALDGSCDLLPDDVSLYQTGWWSTALSNQAGVFNTPPTRGFYFGGTPISTIGYTLFFDAKTDSYPTKIKVTTYEADRKTIKAQAIFNNNSPHWIINFPVQNYYAVKFEFLETSKPYRRIRLLECLFGIVQNFNRDRIVDASFVYGADLLCESFPSRQMVFNFDNSDHKYNLVNPDGLYAYLQEGQEIFTSISINGESVNMGEFEFTKSKALDDEISGQITASDYVLSKLENSIFNGGSNTQTTLQTAVNTVLSGLKIKTSLAYPSYKVSMAIPEKTSKREALRLLAQASKCSIWVDRNLVLQIHPLTVAVTEDDELNADRMPSMGGINVSEPIDKVELTVKNEYVDTESTYTSGTGENVKTVDNPCVAAENGQEVADWLFAQCNRRVKYDKNNMCNPALEIGDTVKIYDAYGENQNAVCNEINIVFDGDIDSIIKGVGS